MIFDTNKELVLEDERVRLSPLSTDHLPALLRFVHTEPQLWQYSVWPPNSKEAMVSYLQTALAKRSQGDSYAFAVWDKKTDSFAGSTRYYDIQTKEDRLQLGYTWYGSVFHGSGLNAHCKLLLLTHAFETLKANRVEFRADANNARSIAAMEGIGASREGILREHTKAWHGWRDVIVLSILAKEWQPKAKPMILKKIQKHA